MTCLNCSSLLRQLDLKGQVIYYRRSNSLEIQFIIAKALDMSSLVRREPGQFINRRDTAFLRQSIQSRSELDSVQHHTVEDDIVNAVARAIETFSRIDILVNAAGTDVPGALAQLSTRDWDHVLAVNLRAPFLLAKAVFPHMSQARRGTIITISSVAGKRGWANASAHCASKLGLTGLTQALAAEGKAHGIRACLVYPGAMATPWGLWSPAERDARPHEAQPPTKALPPAEVAALIVWIAAAPPELVLNEAIVSPLEESGWP